MTDQELLVQAAMTGIAEVELGKLAIEKAHSETVREYARRLVDLHVKARIELAELAGARGIALPAQVGQELAALIARLGTFSIQEFDREYLRSATEHHNDSIPGLRQLCSDPRCLPELKSFAARFLARLEDSCYSAISLEREDV